MRQSFHCAASRSGGIASRIKGLALLTLSRLTLPFVGSVIDHIFSMTDSHVKFKVRKAAIGEFPQIGAFQHAIMKDDPLFQSKFSDVSFEEWLRYKWLGKRRDAVIKSEAAIFIAESEDDEQIIGVIGYLKVKRDKVVFLDDQTIPGSKNLRKILDSKEAYADEWHKQVTDTHGDFLR